MVSEEFLCWGGRWEPFTVGFQCSLYDDAPTTQTCTLARRDRFAMEGTWSALGKINPPLHNHLYLLASQAIHLQQEERTTHHGSSPGSFHTLPTRARVKCQNGAGSCLGFSCSHHRWAMSWGRSCDRSTQNPGLG